MQHKSEAEYVQLFVHLFLKLGTRDSGYSTEASKNYVSFLGDVIDRVLNLSPRAVYAKQYVRDKLFEHKEYIRKYGEDMPEIQQWKEDWGF